MFKKAGMFIPAGMVGLSLAVVSLAVAEEKKAEKKPAVAAPAKPKPAAKMQPGMVVVKDPVTGVLRAPTAEEFAALAAAAGPTQNTATAGERQIAGPGGGVGMVLDDSTAVFSVATRNADGTVTIGEAVGPAAAKAAVLKGAKPAAKGAEKNDR